MGISMQQSDLDGIARSGALARRRGETFHANPSYHDAAAMIPARGLDEWHAVASAWASGWLKEDAGRDHNIARLTHLPRW